MTIERPNAFLRPPVGGRASAGRRGLAGLLAPMRAELTPTGPGFALEVEPMRAVDAFRPWCRLAEPPMEAVLMADETDGESLADVAERLGVPLIARFDANVLVLDPLACAGLIARHPMTGFAAVLVDGPVERHDAAAIASAISANGAALGSELRAIAAVTVPPDRTVRIETRSRRVAAMFLAENFRQYLAAATGRPAAELAAPEAALVEGLLDRTGRLAVRPIETELYSTWIDVGVNTETSGETRPADASLIYDLPSRSWHGE